MAPREKLVRLFDKLNENDQKKAYEYMQSLAHRSRGTSKTQEVSTLYGKDYFVVSD
jgi:hypothetical protein